MPLVEDQRIAHTPCCGEGIPCTVKPVVVVGWGYWRADVHVDIGAATVFVSLSIRA